jgi:hypothetical protein
VDVVRGAVAEVEEYERVTVAQVGPFALAGRAVGDIIHLLAELIENALSFSPPHTMVNVSGQLVCNGFAVEIEDRGLGMGAADLETANAQLEDPPEFNLSSTARLGLYVVGRLAERHKVKVQLRKSAYGGVTAVVLIPTSLIVSTDSDTVAGPDVLRDRRAAALTGDVARNEDARSEIEQTVAIDRSQVTTLGPRNRTGQRVVPAEEPSTPATEPTPPKAPAPPAENVLPYGAGRTGEVEARTSSGLPRRVRQASLAAPLRQEPAVDAEAVEPDATPRPPEDARRIMSSYQRGTAKARSGADADAPVPQTESDSSTGTGELPGDR